MSNDLRTRLIRLAHAQPDLRSALLPLLVKEAAGFEEKPVLAPSVLKNLKDAAEHLDRADRLLASVGGAFPQDTQEKEGAGKLLAALWDLQSNLDDYADGLKRAARTAGERRASRFPPPRGKRIGYTYATIGLDDRYSTELAVYWSAPELTVQVSSKSPVGGMDGPGGAYGMEASYQETVQVNGPGDLKEALQAIKRAIADDAALARYARPTRFVWDGFAAKGISLKALSEVLFPSNG